MGISNITTRINDATVLDKVYIKAFDVVLCDVPCSGLGVASSKPDILIGKTEESIKDLPELQYKILETCVYDYGAKIDGNYERYSSIPRKNPKELKVIDTDGIEHTFEYVKKRCYQDGNKIILKKN
jgi:hypothetical protein